MIFNDEVVFIHIGKTGGMSCAKYLLNTLKGPIYNCHVDSEKESLQITDRNVIPITSINRHCTLRAANEHIKCLTNQSIVEKKKILAVIRNPYDLEYSFYMHLKKPEVVKRRAANFPELIELANGDFKKFARYSGYHRAGLRQEDYFLIDGDIPENVEIIRHENLESHFPTAVAPYVNSDISIKFPHINNSKSNNALEAILDNELKEIIYFKHQYIFDNFYTYT